ncbi:hypothetical protein ACLOJK_015486 [Asimina triloba]
MNPESSSFTRCAHHPSQNFTGFCSLCLVEKLKSVDSTGRSPKWVFSSNEKQVASSLPISGSEKKPQETRARKTLLLLFQLDDNVGQENAARAVGEVEDSVTGRNIAKCRNVSDSFCVGSKFERVTGASPLPHLLKNDQETFDLEMRFCKNGIGPKNVPIVADANSSRASSSASAIDDPSVVDGIQRQRMSVEYDSLKEKHLLIWWGSVFSKKVLKWSRFACKRNPTTDNKAWNVGFRKEQMETKVGFRNSCDQQVSHNSNKVFWEDPRHSWDGVVMNKAVAPSFTGIGETIDGNLFGTQKNVSGNSLPSHRRRMSLPEEDMLVDSRPSTDTKEVGNHSTLCLEVEKSMSARGFLEPNGDAHYQDLHQGISVLNSRRKFCGWSKVWNLSLTSPFRDFSKKRENTLERSLSESWRGIQGDKNMEAMESDGGLHLHGGGINGAKDHFIGSRSRNVGNSDIQRPRPDCQKRKDLLIFGRSRSVHYPSPGNLENGLLRFYLTPLRSSRRNRKSRLKTSRSFARGIFGF